MHLKIDRSRWLRGNRRTSMLRNDDGYMCCLGFYCEQAGVSPNTLWSQYTPEHLPILVEGLSQVEDERLVNTEFSNMAMTVNDSEVMSEQERESYLIDLFRKNGHEISFYN